jgi:7,8-dihydropterin-6-yl-methyl-4-(beta-D-ribofuranosyl)aminobenzene 5'-phosphate synthase
VRLARLIFLLPMLALFSAATALAQTSFGAPAGKALAEVRNLRVTILSTMLADDGIGEWEFAALVETDGHKILYDTGARPTTVLENAREVKIDLSGVQDVILSHHHDDHPTGLITLRRELSRSNPAALSRVRRASV